MLQAVTDAISTVLAWVGSFVTSLTSSGGELAPLLPLFAISVAVSAVLLGVRLTKSVIWGA